MNKKIYTTENQIKSQVYNAYNYESTELSSLFFDFDVKMTKGKLLQIYADIQQQINGDSVIYLENPVFPIPQSEPVRLISQSGKFHHIVEGKRGNIITDKNRNEIYEGNYRSFLESFNGKEHDTGLYRIMNAKETENGLIRGIKLDFIW